MLPFSVQSKKGCVCVLITCESLCTFLTVISPDIQTEIKIMKELQHKHLLRLYAVCTVDEPFCIVTELMKNGSLKKYLISKCNNVIMLLISVNKMMKKISRYE